LSLSHESLRLVWNPKVHYRVQKTPPQVPILNQIHPVLTFSPYFFKIRCNIIFPSTPRSREWSVFLVRCMWS